jgi:hypothetical protein
MSLAKMVMYLWIPKMMGNLLTSMKIVIFSELLCRVILNSSVYYSSVRDFSEV